MIADAVGRWTLDMSYCAQSDAPDRASLNPVKSLRIFVLVLLAMLLPLRGVSAATGLCEQLSTPHAEALVLGHGDAMASDAGHDHSQPHDHDHSGADKARHCVSSCSATALMTALPTLASAPMAGTTAFPHFAAPSPTFLSGGQERPPRSI
ncbi:MAG: hypothetical protein KF891_03090 [Rhizobacter sp.]|nr:hypothetical protein [Rhizobacter sp.]